MHLEFEIIERLRSSQKVNEAAYVFAVRPILLYSFRHVEMDHMNWSKGFRTRLIAEAGEGNLYYYINY